MIDVIRIEVVELAELDRKRRGRGGEMEFDAEGFHHVFEIVRIDVDGFRGGDRSYAAAEVAKDQDAKRGVGGEGC